LAQFQGKAGISVTRSRRSFVRLFLSDILGESNIGQT
jgi:hypothetical protein